MRHILAAQKKQQVTSYHRHQWTSQAFLKIDVKVVGLLDAQLIRDIYFKKQEIIRIHLGMQRQPLS